MGPHNLESVEVVQCVKGFEKMSNDKLNQSVKDAYLDKVRGGM